MRKALVLGVVAVALVASFAANSLSQAAQSSTVSWDVRLSDTAADLAAGDGDGLIEVGENPTAAVTLTLDVSGGAAPLEPFFDVATTQFDGQAPFAAADLAPVFGLAAIVPTGTTVGSGVFSIESSGAGALPNTQCDATGGNTVSPPAFTTLAGGSNIGTLQPAAIPVMPGETWVGAYVQTFDDDDNTAPVIAPGVAVQDESPAPGDFAEDQEDTAPANGVPDGVDRMPYFIPTLLAGPFAGLQPGYLGRGYAIAVVVPGVAQTSVHFLNFVIGDADGDTDEDYLTFTVLGDVVTPGAPGPGQTTITCAPFTSTTTANGAALGGALPLRTMGVVSYTGALAAPVGPVGTYRILKSSTDNYDGDDVPTPFDNCEQFANTAQTDTDGDGAGDACDPVPGTANDDEDGDGWYNLTDNCPSVSNVGQSDADSDTVGDACDSNPLTEGNGLGYPAGGGIYEDDDDICDDPWIPGAAEPAGDAVGAPPSRYCTSLLAIVFNDSDDDLRPDYIAALGVVDADSDRDFDGLADCTESGGGGVGACPAGAASDALDPQTGTFAGALFDSDGDGHPDQQEVIDIARGTAGANRSVPQCGAASADPLKTGSDLDYDGTVTILDLSTAAGFFNGSYAALTYHFGSDLDKDASNTILDLSTMAGYFNVAACP